MSDFGAPEPETGSAVSPGKMFKAVMEQLRHHYLLLIGLLVFYGIVAVIVAVVVPPTYTATATLGPPYSSLSGQMLASTAAGGGLAGFAAKVTGMGSSQGDPFQTYTELLTSNRLAYALAKQPGFLEAVFYKRYDSDKHQWEPRSGPVDFVMDSLLGAFHYPVSAEPSQDDLARFLTDKLDVETSLTSSFVTVSFKFHKPAEAERLLKIILATADSLVREDMREEETPRLAYLERELPTVTQSEERDNLIQMLSTQQQLMMVIAADKPFAVDYADPAHVDMRPTFPNVFVFAAVAVVLAAATWAGLIFYVFKRWSFWGAGRAQAQPEGYRERRGPFAWVRRLWRPERGSESW